MVRQRYGTAVTAEVLEASVSEATQQVLSERGLRPALQPKMDVISLDPQRYAAKDLEFKVELELLPEITLPDFGAISLTRMKVEAPPRDGGQGACGRRPAQPGTEEITTDELGDRGAAKGEVLSVDYVGPDRRCRVSRRHRQRHRVEIGGHGLHPRLQRAARRA